MKTILALAGRVSLLTWALLALLGGGAARQWALSSSAGMGPRPANPVLALGHTIQQNLLSGAVEVSTLVALLGVVYVGLSLLAKAWR